MARPKAAVPKVHVSPDPPYTAYWYSGGKMYQRGCAAATREKAIEIAGRKFQEWLNPPPPPAYTIGQLVDAYSAEKTDPNNPERAESPTFLINLKHVRGFYANYTAAMMTPTAWRSYRAYRGAMEVDNAGTRSAKVRVAKPVKDSTIKRELNALRGALYWGRDAKWAGLEGFKMELKGFAEDNARHVFLTRVEFNRLIDALNETPHLQLFCLLSVATAARMSAVLEMKWDAVSISHGDTPMPLAQFPLSVGGRTRPRPDGRKTAPATWSWSNMTGVAPIASTKEWRTSLSNMPVTFDLGRGKGNKKRGSGYVGPENKRLYVALGDAYRNKRSEYVIEWRGKGVQSVDLSDAFERAEIPKAKRTQHVLKHTACSWMRQAGIPWADMASLTGTSEETLRRHYAHIAPEHLARASAAVAV